MKSSVYVKFPKAGLGNMLLVWANAAVFAHINHLKLQTASWWSFHWGAWLRGEAKKRFYFGYFNESGFMGRVQFLIKGFTRDVVLNPLLERVPQEDGASKKLYIFNKLMTHEQMFLTLAPHKQMLSDELYAMLLDGKKRELESFEVPEMSVHIRRGDFKTTGQTTSLDFFVKGIESTRKALGRDIPVTVFSDAAPHELAPLFDLPVVSMASPKADILDILLMSKSKIIMLSQSSSFSYWAAFLSEALVIMKYDDWQEKLRDKNENYQEVRFDHADRRSSENLVRVLQGNLSCTV